MSYHDRRIEVLRGIVGVIEKREFTAKQRAGAAKTGEAMPDGSFPIGNMEDIHNAVSLLGQAKDPTEAKAHIIRRATALGAESELPSNWKPKKKGPDKAAAKEDEAVEKSEDEGIEDILQLIAKAGNPNRDPRTGEFGSSDGEKGSATLMHSSGQSKHATVTEAVKAGAKKGGSFSVVWNSLKKTLKDTAAVDSNY